jgi:hypothetical protein
VESQVFIVDYADQVWCVLVRQNDGWTLVSDWTKSTAIQSDGWNELTVFSNGADYKLSINGVLVFSFTDKRDNQLTNGELGITIWADPSTFIQFEFDNIVVVGK